MIIEYQKTDKEGNAIDSPTYKGTKIVIKIMNGIIPFILDMILNNFNRVIIQINKVIKIQL